MTSEPSGRLYSAVTKHWPRIATGSVAIVAGVDLLIGRLSSDTVLEFYVFAWATTTGAIWVLSEKAENALSDEARDSVIRWTARGELRSALETLPTQFAKLFDGLFGERHLSLDCFAASVVATFVGLMVGSAGKLAVGNWSGHQPSRALFVLVLLFALACAAAIIRLRLTRIQALQAAAVASVLLLSGGLVHTAITSDVQLFLLPSLAGDPSTQAFGALVLIAYGARATWRGTLRLSPREILSVVAVAALVAWHMTIGARLAGTQLRYSVLGHLILVGGLLPSFVLGLLARRFGKRRTESEWLVLGGKAFFAFVVVAGTLEAIGLEVDSFGFSALMVAAGVGFGALVFLLLLGYQPRGRRVATVGLAFAAVPLCAPLLMAFSSIDLGLGAPTLLYDPNASAAAVNEATSGFYLSRAAPTIVVLLGVLIVNVLSDYLSLLETRWAIGQMTSSGTTLLLLLLDIAATFVIWLSPALTALGIVWGTGLFGVTEQPFPNLAIDPRPLWTGGLPEPVAGLVQISLLSALFTSVWLWLYLSARVLSAALVRLNDGVGFLLKASDVERQPFRSMGFVSVIIVSVLFALGLPLVLV